MFNIGFEAIYSSSARDIEARDWSSRVDFEAMHSSSVRDIEATD
jgi:hypothetical protein